MIRGMLPMNFPPAFEEPSGGWPLPDPFVPRNSLLEALGASTGRAKPARRNLDLLGKGRARIVVTGQQPCFPLPLGLTLQKAATAVAVAEIEEQRLGRPVIPLFWNGSDDSDFEEARGQYWVREAKDPLWLGLTGRLHSKGAMVGNLLPAGAWKELCRLFPAWNRVKGPKPNEDLGDFHARLLAGLFAPWGMLVLDARNESIAGAARDLYFRYAGLREYFSKDIDEEGDRIEARGEARPLRSGVGRRALYFRKSGRRVLPPEKDYDGALARRLAEGRPALLPNVALRPLVQDSILPVIGAVLGPSEWLYHRQILPGFESLGLDFPRPWPRLQAHGLEEDRRQAPPPGGRQSSPLAEGPGVLADPEHLVAAARVHLAEWSRKGYYRMIMEDDR